MFVYRTSIVISNKFIGDAVTVNRLAEPTASRAPEGMAGLAKGLAILESFGAEQPELTISEAAQKAGITRAAARRCLLQLTELGYLVHIDKGFRPTPRMVRLGRAYLVAAPLPTLAQTELAKARDRLGEPVSLTVLDTHDAMFVARANAEHAISTGFHTGTRVPAWSLAAGRVLLGALGEQELDDYLQAAKIQPRNARTIVDPTMLRHLIGEARGQGYAVTNEEIERGMLSIAVPVRDSSGKIVAAVSASTVVIRVTPDRMLSDFLPVLRNSAMAIQKLL